MLTAATGQNASLPAAAVVAACALVFTVLSFWWLNARQGRLYAYAPHSFAATITEERISILLPLVVFNSGPKPIIVQDMRLVFLRSGVSLPWHATREKLRVVKGDEVHLPSVFAVNGRTAQQIFVEFGAAFPLTLPEPEAQDVIIECKMGHRSRWVGVLKFPLLMGNIWSPANYVGYSNTIAVVDVAKIQQGRAEFERLKKMAQSAARAD
ncbi:hypothetical protein [Streptomyces marincola]|uniref:hypothetical protein n=1 Tax=Streptomyces marincola TaxID=2878388 RepID=UPI001CF404F1|nr:hypothetical protein [Streptomyces marincola]UCM89267.1 hypothetical protein LC193_15660 [Streptomyces marincola]